MNDDTRGVLIELGVIEPRTSASADNRTRCVCGQVFDRDLIRTVKDAGAMVHCTSCGSSLSPDAVLRHQVGKQCGVCCQKIRKLNPHSMDGHKTIALSHFAALKAEGWECVQPVHDARGLLRPRGAGTDFQSVPNAREHVQRLHWFGLLHKIHGRRTGGYSISKEGVAFLAGDHAVPRTIQCLSGLVVERSAEVVRVADIRSIYRDPGYWDTYGQLQVVPWNAPKPAVEGRGHE